MKSTIEFKLTYFEVTKDYTNDVFSTPVKSVIRTEKQNKNHLKK